MSDKTQPKPEAVLLGELERMINNMADTRLIMEKVRAVIAAMNKPVPAVDEVQIKNQVRDLIYGIGMEGSKTSKDRADEIFKLFAPYMSQPEPVAVDVKTLIEALRFYAGDDALAHVDDEVKQEYVNGAWGDFGDLARSALSSITQEAI